MPAPEALPEADWLGFCRRAAQAARDALRRFPTAAERSVETTRGEGGDMALVIDRAAEDAVLTELEALGVPLTAVSEERGELELHGGGPVHVVIDPVDGSLNAKRRLPFAAVSIAVAAGPRMADVQVGYVAELGAERVRAMGSVAVTLCLVAAGQLDAMVSLRDVRSVDAAAGQLLVEEAGGAVRFPADDSLSLAMRSPVAAARDFATLERVLGAAWQG